MANQTSIVSLHTTLLSAMLGASIGLAIDKGIDSNSGWGFLAIVVLVLHTVNFYHGKTVALYDVGEVLKTDARPFVRNTLIIWNSLLFLAFCVMAAGINKIEFLIGGQLMVRVVDIGIVAAQQRIFDRSPGRRTLPPETRQQLRYWQVMNFIVLVSFALAPVVLLPHLPDDQRYPAVVIALTVFVAVDLVIEYTAYRNNYFQRLANWDTLAQRWDRVQGRYGDLYRKEIVHPFVQQWVSATGHRDVIDLGAGNGCTARWLADHLSVNVLSIDNSSLLIDIANLYRVERGSVKCIVGAIDAHNASATLTECKDFRGRSEGNLAFISLFGAQDCQNLSAFFANLRRMMISGERVLLVFETEASFDPNAVHSATVRAWKFSWTGRERLQVVNWLPVTQTDPTSLFVHSAPDSSEVISLLTHHRTVDDFMAHAAPHRFQRLEDGPIAFNGEPSTPSQLAYQRQPKFAYLELVLEPVAQSGISRQHPALLTTSSSASKTAATLSEAAATESTSGRES